MKKICIALVLLLTLCLATGCLRAFAETESTGGETDIQFTDGGITASASDGLKIDGTGLTITGAGTYVLSGSCADGSVKVKKGVTGVRLVLSGLSLTSQSTAPIVCGKGTEVVIEAATGTENTLADAESNADETNNTDAENAVVKCKDGSQVVLCGAGTLNIQANAKNGLKSGASTEEDGEASLTIRDLTLRIDAPVNDAVNAAASLNVESGRLTLSAGDDALHCDYALNIGADGTQGPEVTITACNEGLEGAEVNVRSGSVSILSSDDCINAANAELSGYDFALNISGGTIVACTSGGDGFDSNGDLTISGGSVTVWSASAADNQPLDADGTVTISGGTVLAAGGSSGMGMRLQATQPCVLFGGSGVSGMPGQFTRGGFSGSQGALLTEGSAFTLTAGSAVLCAADAKYNASFLLFSCAELSDSEECVLSSGESQTTGTVQTGDVSTGMGGMGGRGFPGGQRPGGERSDGQRPDNAPSSGFNGQMPGNPPQRGAGEDEDTSANQDVQKSTERT